MGIKTWRRNEAENPVYSEKPPHHMGIKTLAADSITSAVEALKNLPTTWGLRRISDFQGELNTSSEKPPHHMGIKTEMACLSGFEPL